MYSYKSQTPTNSKAKEYVVAKDCTVCLFVPLYLSFICHVALY